jgi:hypothetical protein
MPDGAQRCVLPTGYRSTLTQIFAFCQRKSGGPAAPPGLRKPCRRNIFPGFFLSAAAAVHEEAGLIDEHNAAKPRKIWILD